MATSKSRTTKADAKSAAIHAPDLIATKSLDSGNLDHVEAHQLLRKSLLRGKPGDTCKYWGLPARGGYSGGCMAGKAAAKIYVKFLRNHNRGYGGSSLQHIALDMLSGKRESDSLRGQAVGFFSIIDQIVVWASRQMEKLDDVTFESIAQEIDKGLARTQADDDAEITAERSQIAREAWARRKAKARRHPRRTTRKSGAQTLVQS